MDKYYSNKTCKSGGGEEKKKEPGKGCVVMFCNKTNADGSPCINSPLKKKFEDNGFRLLPKKRDSDSWKQGSGHICSHHFTPEDYHDYGMKSLAMLQRCC